jgi:acyl carrier protein
MGPAEIYPALERIARAVLVRDDLILTPETTANDVPGWDSFKMVEIVVAVEELFDIRIHSRDLDRLNNVGDLVTMISDKVGNRTGPYPG